MLTLLALLSACNPSGELMVDTGARPPTPAQPSLLTQAKPLKLPTGYAGLVESLAATESRDAAHAELVSRGDEAVHSLMQVAMDHPDLPTRGWAIQALGDIPGDQAGQALETLQYADVPTIVQAWAGAARIQRTTALFELLALADTAVAMPALQRPLELKAAALADQIEDVGQALEAMATGPSVLQPILAPAVLAQGPGKLVQAMLSHPNGEARRLAAGLLGTLEQQQPGVGAVVAASYAPDPDAKQVLWAGGPLYVPALGWTKADARVLVTHLISWQVFCNERGLTAEINQIRNNMNSLQLLDPAGFSRGQEWPASETTALVRQWARIHGEQAVVELLTPWGLQGSPKYVRTDR